MADISSFGEFINQAQLQEQSGNHVAAIESWRQAQARAADDVSWGQAARGEAVSTWRAGNNPGEALAIATRAVTVHKTAYEEHGGYDALRQVPESLRVLGRMQLLRALNTERIGVPSAGTLDQARAAIGDGAPFIQHMVELFPDVPDQHVINWWPTAAAVYAFAGNSDGARDAARQAKATARFSERPGAPTSANISAEYAAEARFRDRVQALGITLVTGLVTPQPSLRRSLARTITTRII